MQGDPVDRRVDVAGAQQRGQRRGEAQASRAIRQVERLDPEAVAGADLVLFSVKSGDTEATGEAIRSHLRPDALVLCLQNGVDNAERLRTVLPPAQVAAAVVYVEDPFVERELSLETAALVPSLRTWVTNEYLHGGLRHGGGDLLDRLLGMTKAGVAVRGD